MRAYWSAVWHGYKLQLFYSQHKHAHCADWAKYNFDRIGGYSNPF